MLPQPTMARRTRSIRVPYHVRRCSSYCWKPHVRVPHHARLRLTYGPAADAGPSHLFLKSRRDGIDPGWHELGRKEAPLYFIVAATTPADLLHSVIWWNHLERIMAAVHDLDCLELLP